MIRTRGRGLADACDALPGPHGHREIPVLVVGAGPAGLVTALALADQGIGVLVVEQRTTLSTLPRATAVSTRTMELLRRFGLEGAVRAAGVDVEWQQRICATLAEVDAGQTVTTGFPTRAESALVSPSAPACVPQDHLEPILADRLRQLGTAELAMGTELSGIVPVADGVLATLRPSGGGAPRTVHARYVVAADGARSPVRSALGIAMEGPGEMESAVLTQFRAPLWDLLGPHRYGIYPVTHPGAPGVFLPAGPDDRWLYGVVRGPGSEAAFDALAARSPEVAARQVRLGAGVPDLDVRVERIGTFTFTAQIAERFRHGDVFLAGDAAHRVTPRGGTGLNTAIHDGFDLGWRLAWVLRGWAGPELLDGYEAERRPGVEHNVARSADATGARRPTIAEIHADLGGRLPHTWVDGGPDGPSTIDLLGPGLALFTGPDAPAWRAAAGALAGGPPIVVRPLAAVVARSLGIRADGALLARPDGTPAGWFPTSAAADGALADAVAAVTAGAGVERPAARGVA